MTTPTPETLRELYVDRDAFAAFARRLHDEWRAAQPTWDEYENGVSIIDKDGWNILRLMWSDLRLAEAEKLLMAAPHSFAPTDNWSKAVGKFLFGDAALAHDESSPQGFGWRDGKLYADDGSVMYPKEEEMRYAAEVAAGVYKNSDASLRTRLEAAECPDKLTAGALARLIEANKVPSPWRDTGTRLKAFGRWLAALAGEEKP